MLWFTKHIQIYQWNPMGGWELDLHLVTLSKGYGGRVGNRFPLLNILTYTESVMN